MLGGEWEQAVVKSHGPLSELVDSAAPYRAVRPEDVQMVAARYLDPEARVEGVVRGGQRA